MNLDNADVLYLKDGNVYRQVLKIKTTTMFYLKKLFHLNITEPAHIIFGLIVHQGSILEDKKRFYLKLFLKDNDSMILL